MIVAIDGPAGSGKSAIARMVGENTGFTYINSGLFYRALTRKVLNAGRHPGDREQVLPVIENTRLQWRDGELYLDDEPIAEHELRTDEIDAHVAQLSAVSEVRTLVNAALRDSARRQHSVVEGRDITTVVFPDAEVKIYLDAGIDARAERRYRENTSGLSLVELKAAIADRDRRDREKQHGGLKRSEDAFYLDTSDLTINTVYDTVMKTIRLKVNQENR